MKKIILALSVLFTTNIMAGNQVAIGTVKTISVNPTSVIIGWSTTITNNDNCTHPNSTNTLILPLTDATKGQFSVLLSANVTGKKARVLYNGCVGTIPAVIRVDLLAN